VIATLLTFTAAMRVSVPLSRPPPITNCLLETPQASKHTRTVKSNPTAKAKTPKSTDSNPWNNPTLSASPQTFNLNITSNSTSTYHTNSNETGAVELAGLVLHEKLGELPSQPGKYGSMEELEEEIEVIVRILSIEAILNDDVLFYYKHWG
jgi:hypothetical protein